MGLVCCRGDLVERVCYTQGLMEHVCYEDLTQFVC